MEAIKNAIIGNGIFRVLRVKPFFFMMASEFFSQLAFNMQQFVLIFIIYGKTSSNTAVSGLILSFTIPAILFSIFAGVFIDRWNKKKVLFYTNLIRGFLFLPFLLFNLNLAFIYLFTFFIAIATQFFIPAESAIIPQLVPKNLIVSANAIFAFGIYSTMLVGYVLSGPTLLFLGKSSTVLFLALLYFASTIFIASIKLAYGKKEMPPEEQMPSLSFVYQVREIFSYIKGARKVMQAVLILTIAQAVLLMFAVLGPGYVTTILALPLESLSWIFVAPAGIGMVIGILLLGSFGWRFNRKLLSVFGFLMVGIAFILLPFGSHIASFGLVQVIGVLAFIVGFALALVFIPSNTTIQVETSERMRGRMYGLLSSLAASVSFLPVILSGGLADIIGVGSVITGVGFLMIVLSGVFYFLK